MHQAYTRLPKLPFPTFDAQPIQWQSFWDAFTAVVDSNPGLSPGQKLNNLRTQIQGDAARVIGGFQLSNDNYPHCVALLKERLVSSINLLMPTWKPYYMCLHHQTIFLVYNSFMTP